MGPGDEVLVPPYTFVATINVVLMQYALPVFVDTDRRTFQIDAKKIQAAITDQTRSVIPVHLGGNVAEWAVGGHGEGVLLGGSADVPADKRARAVKAATAYRGLRVVRGS